MSNPLQSTRIEFHILQSFPVSCLNRDDVGAPKNALIGGTQRARVSSQCWKRAIRRTMKEMGVTIATRTCLVVDFVSAACRERGATDEQASACGEALAKILQKIKNKDEKSNTLIYISKAETDAVAEFFKAHGFDADACDGKDLLKVLKSSQRFKGNVMDGVDIALFGRMVASAPEVNVDAAVSVAHAISTHKAVSEVEFFTAVDDLKEDNDQQGAGHMGSLEFNAATYYRYISLDLGQLLENLGGDADLDLTPVITSFTKALFQAVPSARQSTMTASPMWDYAKVLVRKGQRLQVSFEDAVKTTRVCPSLLKASKATLQKQLERQEKLSGSLFGKIADFEFGEDLDFSIDDLADELAVEVQKLQHA